MKKGGIAFFDSGIGGLTVMSECRKAFKNELFYYYGDNENAPYGNRSDTEVLNLVFSAFRRLAALNPKAVVIGCNTATAVCVERLRSEFSFPIIGTEPAVFSAAKEGGRVLVLATRVTTENKRFQSLCSRAASDYPHADIQTVACERLAIEIEKNILNANFDCTPFLPVFKADSVVLGCTHYVFQKEKIRAFYGSKTFDGNAGVCNRLREILLKSSVPATLPATSDVAPIIYLGNAKRKNQFIFEQTFVL